MPIVEDENRDVLMLQWYHQEEEYERTAEEILGEGTVVIVKEPYLKLMSDGDYGIRVDHISYLPEDDDRLPNCWCPRFTECEISANT